MFAERSSSPWQDVRTASQIPAFRVWRLRIFRGMHSSDVYREIEMKSTVKAILVGGLIVAAQAAIADNLAFPSSGDDPVHVSVQSTYMDRHASDPVRRTAPAFPSAGDDPVHVSVRSTYSDLHAGQISRAPMVFPSAGDDADLAMAAGSTYADSRLDRAALASRPAQAADTGAN
jgi:hypothetical protein